MKKKKENKKPYLYKTTIQVTGSLIAIYDKMVSRYSVTTAVSAGIAILDSLDAQDRESWIDRINEMCEADKNLYEENEMIKKHGGLKKYIAAVGAIPKVSLIKVAPVLERLQSHCQDLDGADQHILELFTQEVHKKIKSSSGKVIARTDRKKTSGKSV